jgi:para-nitrobenzyl esterase
VEVDSNTVSWRGVPFAKPPVGTLRWQPTQAPDSVDGRPIGQGLRRGMQPNRRASSGRRRKARTTARSWETFYKQIGSEDCLYLNVWSPAAASDLSKLPVIVYIHGGSNVVGAAFDPLLLGGNLAKNANAVVVTVAYRLGLFGWFANPAFNTGDPIHDSGNYALLDLIQSLKFVKNNIANFGGDPGNVTIMGQSAGSTNVNALIVSPSRGGPLPQGHLAERRHRRQLDDGRGEQVERDHQCGADQGSARHRQGVGRCVPHGAECRMDQELPDDEDGRRPLRHPGRSHGG